MKKGAEDRIYRMAALIVAQISEMFQNEDCENYIDLDEEDATEFMHALLTVAPASIYMSLTEEQKDVLEINHMANTLCFQYTKRPN